MVGEANRLAAVLFDMDGTLVDSEKIWDIALAELAVRYGGVLSTSARAAMVGTSVPVTMRLLHEDLGQPWRDPVEGARWLDDRMVELLAAGLEWRPGALSLLRQVRAAAVPTALVTSTARRLVDVAMVTLERGNFDVVVCGDEVVHTKPHPEPYLRAAASLGVSPGACVAIEDSPSGVASALAAGCVVIAVPQHVAVREEGAWLLDSLAGADLDLVRSLIR